MLLWECLQLLPYYIILLSVSNLVRADNSNSIRTWWVFSRSRSRISCCIRNRDKVGFFLCSCCWNFIQYLRVGRTWEWMPNHKLRSYVSIMHYIAYYVIAKYLVWILWVLMPNNWSLSTILMQSNSFQLNSFSPSVGPRVVQAILGTLGDLYLFRVARYLLYV